MLLRILKGIGNAIVWVVLIGVSIYPLLWTLVISLKDDRAAYQLPVQWIFKPDFSTYHELLTNGDFIAALINSIELAGIATLLCVFLGAAAAYALARYELRSAGTITMVFAITRIVPSFAIVLPTFFIFRQLNLLDSMFGLVMALTAFQLPLTVLIMVGVFKNVPAAIDEAARMDGAGMIRVFFQIMLPIVRPGLFASAVVTFVLIWNEFLFILVLAGDKLVTIPMFIANFQTDKAILWSQIAASSVISIIPVVILIIFAQKHLLAGLGFGAVKE
ncbi:carbohydrate ABC transporter permease [Actinomycetaceae bacterium MB13-C1-2]|nr:carbohydrate ABC transporter permease [Actinomycetaceae bacterium MB13-C1-2]